MTSSKLSTRAPRGRPKNSKKTSKTFVSGDACLAGVAATREQWLLAQSTTDNYKQYVKRGKAWLQMWQKAGNSLKDEDGLDLPVADALDDISDLTPRVLLIYLFHKCGQGVEEAQGLGYATASGVHAAFKDYFAKFVRFQNQSCYRLTTTFITGFTVVMRIIGD